MTTRSVTVGSDWVQITDGTEDITFQVVAGRVLMRDEATKPAPSAPGHSVTGWMGVSPPTVAWVKASGSSQIELIIS
ncbi:hypothetical protein ABRP55_20205 [Pectobacterium zantedeschiae]|uniref:hypothetical protein n=1 Tax=Pectobacterium zantedeschiae TaxID=2034769 RepID=UPI0032EB95EA